MASQRNLQATVTFTRPFLSMQPLQIGSQDPAISIANMVKRTMCAPPMKWVWNRDEYSFVAVPKTDSTPGQIDYILPISNLGYLEAATLTDSDGNQHPLDIKDAFGKTSLVQRPASICVLRDNENGTVTLRLNTVPDQAYAVDLIFQLKARPMSSVASRWYPIPDELTHITDQGFLAFASLLLKDARFPIFKQQFMAHLVAMQEGLSEVQVTLFMEGMFTTATMQQRASARTQLGTSSRVI